MLPAMPASDFESLVTAEMQKTLESFLRIPPGDAAQHARTVGIHTGLSTALEIFRKIQRRIEGDL